MKSNMDDHFNEGMAAFVGQDYTTCIDKLTRVLDEDATHKIARVSRGAAHLRKGDPVSALTDFDQVIEMDPSYARAYHLRGLAHEVQGDQAAALSDLNTAIELSPDYGAAYNSRASLYTKMGETDLATEDIQMIAHLTQVNIETFANENNVWRSRHMQLESAMESDLNR